MSKVVECIEKIWGSSAITEEAISEIVTKVDSYTCVNLYDRDIEISEDTIRELLGKHILIVTKEYSSLGVACLGNIPKDELEKWLDLGIGLLGIYSVVDSFSLKKLNKRIKQCMQRCNKEDVKYEKYTMHHISILTELESRKGIEYIVENNCLADNKPYTVKTYTSPVWLQVLSITISEKIDTGEPMENRKILIDYRDRLFGTQGSNKDIISRKELVSKLLQENTGDYMRIVKACRVNPADTLYTLANQDMDLCKRVIGHLNTREKMDIVGELKDLVIRGARDISYLYSLLTEELKENLTGYPMNDYGYVSLETLVSPYIDSGKGWRDIVEDWGTEVIVVMGKVGGTIRVNEDILKMFKSTKDIQEIVELQEEWGSLFNKVNYKKFMNGFSDLARAWLNIASMCKDKSVEKGLHYELLRQIVGLPKDSVEWFRLLHNMASYLRDDTLNVVRNNFVSNIAFYLPSDFSIALDEIQELQLNGIYVLDTEWCESCLYTLINLPEEYWKVCMYNERSIHQLFNKLRKEVIKKSSRDTICLYLRDLNSRVLRDLCDCKDSRRRLEVERMHVSILEQMIGVMGFEYVVEKEMIPYTKPYLKEIYSRVGWIQALSTLTDGFLDLGVDNINKVEVEKYRNRIFKIRG